MNAAVTGIFFWMLVELKQLRRYQVEIVLVYSVASVIHLLQSRAPVIGLGYFPERGFPDFSDFLGNYIIFAFGLVLAAKLRHNAPKIGVVLLTFFGVLVVSEAGAWIYSYTAITSFP